jgi:hypothetical protein
MHSHFRHSCARAYGEGNFHFGSDAPRGKMDTQRLTHAMRVKRKNITLYPEHERILRALAARYDTSMSREIQKSIEMRVRVEAARVRRKRAAQQ